MAEQAHKGTTLAEGNRELLAMLKNPQVMRELRAPTGMPYWDRIVGVQRGQFVVLGAENGSGKSSYLVTLLLSAAMRGEAVALLSVEDVAVRLRARLLGIQAGVSPYKLQRAELTSDDWGRVSKACVDNVNTPFRFFEGLNRMDDVRPVLEAQAEAGVRFVAIDYLQALRDARSQDRRNELLNITQEIAHFSRAHGIVCIGVSQVVRPESRKVGTRPTRHWLKEASDIADAADKIVLLWRDQDGNDGPTNVVLDKDKDGEHLGATWALRFDAEKRIREEAGADHA